MPYIESEKVDEKTRLKLAELIEKFPVEEQPV